MEYTTMFEPLLLICLTLCLGMLIGCLATAYASAKELGAINKELEKFREMYFAEIDKLKNTNDN